MTPSHSKTATTGQGCLYVVATPIGNLGDISNRALETLAQVDRIAAEDTRHTRRLLAHYAINTPVFAVHQHNEAKQADSIIALLAEGKSIALVSDAGTPLISDPGYRLVRAVSEAGFVISPLPGPCAFISALSVAGLPSDEVLFQGFLPSKASARQKALQKVVDQAATLVFYEAPHRVLASLADIAELFADRACVVCRELTKCYETIYRGTAAAISEQIVEALAERGEFVILIAGREPQLNEIGDEAKRVLRILAEELPPKQASKLASAITGSEKKQLYQLLTSSK